MTAQLSLFDTLPESATESQIAAYIATTQALHSAASPLPKLPRGFWLDEFTDLAGKKFHRAVDPDGCRWYPEGGEWILNVPWFRRSPGLAPDAPDDIALVDRTGGNYPYPITPAGVIKIGRRRIPSNRWNH